MTMDSPQSMTSQCDCDPNLDIESTLQMPCSSYQPPYASTSIPNENTHTMPRHKSLPPSLYAMYSAESFPNTKVRSMRTSNSTNAIRRSVSGMKSLLPLKLSSSLPSSSWPSPTSDQTSTFGPETLLREDLLGPDTLQSHERPFCNPRPITMRREKYRDTPVYTEPGSPLLNLAYYTDEEVCFDSSAAESSSDEPSTTDDENTSSSDEDIPHRGRASRAKTKHPSRASDLSFKCMGEPGLLGLCLSEFQDEGAWLSSPLSPRSRGKTECLPQLLAESTPVEHDIEGWLSDTSSVCEDFDNSYACATAVIPARAQVVDVNVNRLSAISHSIPPRSSSLVGTRTQPLTPDNGRKSRMYFRDSYALDLETSDAWDELALHNSTTSWLSNLPIPGRGPDLAMSSPPLSPVCFGSPTMKSLNRTGRPTDLQRNAPLPNYSEDFQSHSVAGGDTISRIISALDQSVSDFPSNTLLPSTPCISAIRTHLQQSSLQPHSQWDKPPPPPSRFASGVDWRPFPQGWKTTNFSTAPQRTLSSRTSKTLSPPKSNWETRPPSLPRQQLHQELSPPEPKLHSLYAIFPNSTPLQLSTLYAHLIAYIFSSSLLDDQLISQHTPPPSPLHMPFFTTTSHYPPDKAADRLGICISTPIPRRVDIGGDAATFGSSSVWLPTLVEKVKRGIGWLIGTMGGCGEMNATMLRALVEVVKGCERECFEILA